MYALPGTHNKRGFKPDSSFSLKILEAWYKVVPLISASDAPVSCCWPGHSDDIITSAWSVCSRLPLPSARPTETWERCGSRLWPLLAMHVSELLKHCAEARGKEKRRQRYGTIHTFAGAGTQDARGKTGKRANGITKYFNFYRGRIAWPAPLCVCVMLMLHYLQVIGAAAARDERDMPLQCVCVLHYW